MKTFITIIMMMLMYLGGTNAAEGQTNKRHENAYSFCRMRVGDGDNAYAKGNYRMAKTYYESARMFNNNCTTERFISDEEIQQKLDKCEYAIRHKGSPTPLPRREGEQSTTAHGMTDMQSALCVH